MDDSKNPEGGTHSLDNTKDEVKLFNLTLGNVNFDPSTPFDMHRSTPTYDRLSSTASSDNFSDHSITIASSDNVNEQRRQVNLLCSSFSDLAVDFDTKLCKSFDELALDIEQLSDMIKSTPSAKSPNVEISKAPKPVYIAEPRLDLTNKMNEKQEGGDRADIDKRVEIEERNKTSIRLLTGKLCSLETKVEKELSLCSQKVGALEKRLEKEIRKMNNQLDSTFEYMDTRVDTRMDLIFSQKCIEIDKHFTETFEVIDNKVAQKVNEIIASYNIEKLPNLDEVRAEVNDKVNSLLSDHKRENQSSIERVRVEVNNIREKVDSSQKALGDAVRVSVDEYLSTKEFDLDQKSSLSEMISQTVGHKLDNLNKTQTSQLAEFKSYCEKTEKSLSDLRSSVDFSTDNEIKTVSGAVPTKDLKMLEKKIELLSMWVEQLQSSLQNKSKQVDSIDIRMRKHNLIFDGFAENPNEDIRYEVCSLLLNFVPDFDPAEVDNVYRIGKLLPNSAPRRVFISLYSSAARERILGYAGIIARAGEPGKRIFLNEDLPDEAKRKISDVHKYVNFLKKKNINATQKGDSVIIEGRQYQYEELSHMQNGLSLKDSRTIYKNGVVAFQSHHSPLSNLYQAPIKRNGIIYRSAEHAYQHVKAMHCKDPAIAHTVLKEISPYDAMAAGKRVKITPDWHSKQITIMEEILRAKLEQVPVFADELRATANHRLIENTRSAFWGSGTTYNSDSIFSNNYPGSNQLGKLLEKIREHF